MNVVYIGNFGAGYSTENDVRHGFEANGIDVRTVQENDWRFAGDIPDPDDDTLGLLWTHTHEWGPAGPDARQIVDDAFARYRHAGIPIIGYHLDVWWGLARQSRIYTEPYHTAVDRLVTADGGSDRLWEAAGVQHVWMPPAVSDRNRLDGEARPDRWPTGVVFVGQWSPNNYHPEWPHRDRMIEQLRRRFGRDFTVLPRRPGDKIRGDDLADVYATAAVVVGDSCFAGIRPRYWSDRVPETTGRGGVLVHPFTDWGDAYRDTDIAGWRIGDWDHMEAVIRDLMTNPERAAVYAEAGQTTTRAYHTYTRRAAALADMMERLRND